MILVDSSVWISFFRSGAHSTDIEYLTNEQLLATNEAILTEIIPFLQIQNKQKTIRTMGSLSKLPLNINWQNVNASDFSKIV